MDILIESSQNFEDDLTILSPKEKVTAIKQVNNFINLFFHQKKYAYSQLHHFCFPSNLNGYESSLYSLKITEKLGLILSIDEDPIFEQIIFTLFRVVKHDELEQAYREIA